MKLPGRLTKTKVLTSIIMIVAILASITACGGGETVTKTVTATGTTTAPEAITLKLFHHYSPPELATGSTPIFVDRVNAQAQGALVINIMGGIETMPLADQFEALKSGVVELLASPLSIWSAQQSEIELINLTKVKTTGASDPVLERKTGVYDYINEAIQEQGLYLLGRVEVYQPWYVFTNKEVNSLDDLSKIKLGTPSRVVQSYAKDLLGVEPINIQPPDLYTSLERGMVDGIMVPVAMYSAFSCQEVTKYVIMPPFSTHGSVVMLIRLDTWNSLPKDMQDLLQEAMTFTESMEEAQQLGREQRDLQRIYDAGVTPVQLSEADLERFRQTVYDSNWNTISGLVSPETYEEMQAVAAKTYE